MVAANYEVVQWDSGFTPQQEGEVLDVGIALTFRAEDDILKNDAVCYYGSGSTWNWTNAKTVANKPSVIACGTNATDQFKFIGFAMGAASSGEEVTVKFKGVFTAKTNKAITAGAWVRPSKWAGGEKYGCVYESDNTGDIIIGIALNETEAPASAGTGTTSDPFNMRPVSVLIINNGDPLNR